MIQRSVGGSARGMPDLILPPDLRSDTARTTERRNASLTCAAYAHDANDLIHFLDVLGLLTDPEGENPP